MKNNAYHGLMINNNMKTDIIIEQLNYFRNSTILPELIIKNINELLKLFLIKY